MSLDQRPQQSFKDLKGPDGLAAVTRRFSNAVDVVRYAMEFYKGLADLEEQYANGLAKLLRSPCYTFKQNFLMQWLGNESTEELGSLNSGWVKLGKELHQLVKHHHSMSKDLTACVRHPLEKFLPTVEQLKVHLKTSSKQLTQELEAKEKQHVADKNRYDELCKEWQKLEDKLSTARSQSPANTQAVAKAEQAHSGAMSAMLTQENKYRSSVTDLLQAQLAFERQSEELLRQTEATELDRVKVMKASFQELAKTVSNTAPIYLEGMQRMVLFTDGVDARRDVETFVHTHGVLKNPLSRPEFCPHPKRATAFADYSRPGSKQFTPGQDSQAPGSGGGDEASSSGSFAAAGKTREQKLDLAGRPDLDEDEPIVLPEGLTDGEEGMMRRLFELGRSNDYYGLVGAAPSASKAELAKARRHKTLHLHPDHFGQDSESKKSASEALSLVNQVYTDVLTKDSVRSLYDQLCDFRLSYGRMPSLSTEALVDCDKRLNDMKNGLRKARAPANLTVEVEQALMVANHFRSVQYRPAPAAAEVDSTGGEADHSTGGGDGGGGGTDDHSDGEGTVAAVTTPSAVPASHDLAADRPDVAATGPEPAVAADAAKSGNHETE